MSAFENNGFDLVKFINEGFASQSKYGKKAGDKFTPDELQRIDKLVEIGGSETFANFEDAMKFRYAKMIEHMGHMVEEMVEARVYIPRRSWKNEEPSFLDSPQLRSEFMAEMFDILLFFRAVLAYGGVTGEEFLQASRQKMNYNSKRPDHNVNGDAKAERDPAAELKGDCPSADYAV